MVVQELKFAINLAFYGLLIKLLKCHLKGDLAVGLNTNNSEKQNGHQTLICPYSRVIYMYINNIQTCLPKPIGQSKPYFISKGKSRH